MKRRTALGAVAAGGAALGIGLPAGGADAAPAAADRSGAGGSAVHVTGLRVGGMTGPVGIDDAAPRFSWYLTSTRRDQRQTAYQVRVATGTDRLARPDRWDSGRVTGAAPTGVAYGGTALKSRERLAWQVRCWDADGVASAWSHPATFEMGLLAADDWTARWITHPDWLSAPNTTPLPLLARRFDARPVRRARLYVTGVGIYHATLNGHDVTDAVLEPPNTDYAKRLVYRVHDVTRLLTAGPNVLGVRLGNGTFNVPDTPDRYHKYTGVQGPPKLLAQLELEYTDGTTARIGTDADWRTTAGPTTFGTWYGGEDHDARRETPGWDTPAGDLSDWIAAAVTDPPDAGTVLSARMFPPVVAVDRVSTVRITRPRPDTYVFDLGVNVAGWEELRVSGPAGTTVSIRPGERLTAEGLVDQGTMIAGGATSPPIVDHYTLSGHGTEVWHPRFCYHGMRYLEVTGLPSAPDTRTMSAVVLRADVADAGSFSSASQLYDGIHRIINRSLQSNLFSIPTDCPDREKLGWLEETHLTFPTLARNYDVGAYLHEFLRVVCEAQEASGLVPDIAPQYAHFTGGSYDEPNWGSAVILAALALYRTYGDTDVLHDSYPTMVRYLDYLTGRAQGHLLDYGLGDWGELGQNTPLGVAATYGYYRAADGLAQVAGVLGKHDDAATYTALARDIGAAFVATYRDEAKHTYANGTQAADAFALDLGVIPADEKAAVLDHLVAGVRAYGNHLTVGEIALPAVFRVLAEAGRDDVVHDILAATGDPSYGYQLVAGATSLTEYWDGPTAYGSQSHWMLGAIDSWFAERVGGLRAAPDAVAFADLVVAPSPVGDLDHATVRYTTPYGPAASAWRWTGHTFTLRATVPVGATATVLLPAGSGAPHAPAGARRVSDVDGRPAWRVGSGDWEFAATTERRAPTPPATQFAVNGPRADVPVLGTEPISADFAVHNLSDRAASVTPTVRVGAGFSARAAARRVRVPAHTTVTVSVAVVRTDPDATGATLSLTAGGTTGSVALRETDDWVRVATMTSSSDHNGSSAAFTNDGVTDSGYWHNGVGGWNDGTSKQFPDTLTATWTHPVTLGRVVMYTLDSVAYPAAKDGLRDYDVQVRDGADWRTVASVRSNTAGRVESTFAAVRTTALRLWITDTNDHGYSRVVELEAYTT